LGTLVDGACEAIGRYQLSKDLCHINSIDARKALAIMMAINAREVPISQTMQEEKWSVEASLLELFRSPNWRAKYIQENFYGVNSSVKT